MKIKLKDGKSKGGVTKAYSWSHSLPFVENSRAHLIHRAASVTVHKLLNRPAHFAIHFWCGNVQCGRDKFTFHGAPPRDKLVCQRCEDMAKLCGQPSADDLVGRHVHTGKVKAVRTCTHPEKSISNDR